MVVPTHLLFTPIQRYYFTIDDLFRDRYLYSSTSVISPLTFRTPTEVLVVRHTQVRSVDSGAPCLDSLFPPTSRVVRVGSVGMDINKIYNPKTHFEVKYFLKTPVLVKLMSARSTRNSREDSIKTL